MVVFKVGHYRCRFPSPPDKGDLGGCFLYLIGVILKSVLICASDISDVAPLGLGGKGVPVFYKHAAPPGLNAVQVPLTSPDSSGFRLAEGGFRGLFFVFNLCNRCKSALQLGKNAQ